MNPTQKEVLDSLVEKVGIVVEVAQSHVALTAEKAAYFVGVVTVIDEERETLCCTTVLRCFRSADGTTAILGRVHFPILVQRNSVPALNLTRKFGLIRARLTLSVYGDVVFSTRFVVQIIMLDGLILTTRGADATFCMRVIFGDFNLGKCTNLLWGGGLP